MRSLHAPLGWMWLAADPGAPCRRAPYTLTTSSASSTKRRSLLVRKNSLATGLLLLHTYLTSNFEEYIFKTNSVFVKIKIHDIIYGEEWLNMLVLVSTEHLCRYPRLRGGITAANTLIPPSRRRAAAPPRPALHDGTHYRIDYRS